MSGVYDARRHAEAASDLLDGAEAIQEQIASLTPEQQLERRVSGAVAHSNANLQFTVDLAHAHALTALALSGTDPT